MAKDLATPHELVASFVSGLSDFLTTLVPSREIPDTFTVTLCAGAGTNVSWAADVDCTLVGCYLVQGGGNANTIARSVPGANAVNAVGTATARKIIAFFSATTVFMFQNCREKFRSGEKVYLKNESAGTTVMTLLFET